MTVLNSPGAGKHRILGLDPGLASTGWGIVESEGQRLRCLDYGCIETASQTARPLRLREIFEGITAVIERFGPEEGAIETLYFGRNVTSALSVAEARGVLSLTLVLKNIPVREFTPNAIKKTVTGQTRADKAQVEAMVRILLGLNETPHPDHAADALAAAIAAAHHAEEAVR